MENQADIFERITKDDLTNDLKILADTCGIEVVQNLLRNCASLTIYVPKISHLDKFIIRYIRENSYKSFKLIAKELGVSEQHIRNVFRSFR